jgi:hypothetical protein
MESLLVGCYILRDLPARVRHARTQELNVSHMDHYCR